VDLGYPPPTWYWPLIANLTEVMQGKATDTPGGDGTITFTSIAGAVGGTAALSKAEGSPPGNSYVRIIRDPGFPDSAPHTRQIAVRSTGSSGNVYTGVFNYHSNFWDGHILAFQNSNNHLLYWRNTPAGLRTVDAGDIGSVPTVLGGWRVYTTTVSAGPPFTMKVYGNAVLLGQRTDADLTTYPPNSDNILLMQMTHGHGRLLGHFQQVAMWNTELDATQIAAAYARFTAGLGLLAS
jgi:hypothetical protein